VILDLDDVERLEAGDVLVTTMTSPVWTPLFAIAAAVVTDAGDALSHVAIAAREYGIACVAGTHDATARIPDGAVVTVDGDAGTVHLHG
jgi:pyruvate,water dikinase